MKRLFFATTLALSTAATALMIAQTKPDLSGSWVYLAAQSKADPAINFPTELVIKQTPTDFTFTGSANHQEPYSGVYKFDGNETSFTGPGGQAIAKASWQGNSLVATTTRSYDSPMGKVTVTTQETYSVNGTALTVLRTQTVGDVKRSDSVVYTKSK